MKKLYFAAGILISVLLACQNKPDTTKNEAVTEESVQHNEETAQPGVSISLNNGAKWEANKETTEGILYMTNLVNGYSVEPKAEDCQALKEEMDNAFNTIIEKCTMTGEAHNQLHNYLIPMKEKMEKLNTQDIEACRNAVNELKQYLNNYDRYFV